MNTFCNACQCEDYLSFDKPNKWDKLSLIYGIVMIGIVLFFLGAVIHGIYSLPDELLNESFEITMGEIFDFVIVISLLVSWIIIWIVLDYHIFDYTDKKRRRTF
jgi:hypothetical protein